MIAISFSSMRTYKKCPRRYYYEKIEKRDPIKRSSVLRLGTAVHESLAKLDVAGPIEALATLEESAKREELDPYDAATARVLMVGYAGVYESFDEVIGHEVRFEMPLVNPRTGRTSRTFFLKGFIDLIARVRGNLYVFERKTSGEDISPGSVYWERLTLDEQPGIYWQAVDQGAHQLHAVRYDVIGKPSMKPKKATPEDKRRYTKGKKCKECKGTGRKQEGIAGPCPECEGTSWKEAPRLDARQRLEDESPIEWAVRLSNDITANPDRYYHRKDVVRMENEIERHGQDIWDRAQLMRHSYAENLWPKNPDACFFHNYRCPYWEVCTGICTIDDDTRYQNRYQNKEQADGVQQNEW